MAGRSPRSAATALCRAPNDNGRERSDSRLGLGTGSGQISYGTHFTPISPMTRISIGWALLAFATRLSAQTTDAITAADLKSRLFLLAHDSMAGRATGSEGGFKATEYIAKEFIRLGLVPAGENGGYFQIIPFFRNRADTTVTLQVDGTPLAIG